MPQIWLFFKDEKGQNASIVKWSTWDTVFFGISWIIVNLVLKKKIQQSVLQGKQQP